MSRINKLTVHMVRKPFAHKTCRVLLFALVSVIFSQCNQVKHHDINPSEKQSGSTAKMNSNTPSMEELHMKELSIIDERSEKFLQMVGVTVEDFKNCLSEQKDFLKDRKYSLEQLDFIGQLCNDFIMGKQPTHDEHMLVHLFQSYLLEKCSLMEASHNIARDKYLSYVLNFLSGTGFIDINKTYACLDNETFLNAHVNIFRGIAGGNIGKDSPDAPITHINALIQLGADPTIPSNGCGLGPLERILHDLVELFKIRNGNAQLERSHIMKFIDYFLNPPSIDYLRISNTNPETHKNREILVNFLRREVQQGESQSMMEFRSMILNEQVINLLFKDIYNKFSIIEERMEVSIIC